MTVDADVVTVIDLHVIAEAAIEACCDDCSRRHREDVCSHAHIDINPWMPVVAEVVRSVGAGVTVDGESGKIRFSITVIPRCSVATSTSGAVVRCHGVVHAIRSAHAVIEHRANRSVVRRVRTQRETEAIAEEIRISRGNDRTRVHEVEVAVVTGILVTEVCLLVDSYRRLDVRIRETDGICQPEPVRVVRALRLRVLVDVVAAVSVDVIDAVDEQDFRRAEELENGIPAVELGSTVVEVGSRLLGSVGVVAQSDHLQRLGIGRAVVGIRQGIRRRSARRSRKRRKRK